MKVHIFKDENVYILSLLEFLSRHFDLSDHQFIFRCKSSGKKIPVVETSVHFLPGINNFLKVKQITSKASKVYFHLLPSGPDLILWYLNRSVFKKSAWIFWGADVYAYRNKNKSIKHFIYNVLYRRIIRTIPDICGFLRGDFEIIQQAYPTRASYHHVIYPLPTNFGLCDRLSSITTPIQNEKLRILLGNSGDKSNHHLEALDLLRKFNNEAIEVICPLSYGARDPEYVEKVRSKGNAVFGPKFIVLENFMPAEDYLKFLATIDVAVMNHDRQQGLGNIISLLYLGKKIFMRREITSFDYFSEKKITVFGIDDINRLAFPEFKSFSAEESKANKKILAVEFSEESFRFNWKKVLELN